MTESTAERGMGSDERTSTAYTRCPVMTRSDATVIVGGLLALCILRLVNAPLSILACELAFLIGVISVLESARNLRPFVVDDYPLVLALSLGWVAVLRVLHVAAEPSLAFLAGASPALQEEFELAATILLGAGMLLAPFVIGKRLRLGALIAAQALVTLVLAIAIQWGPRLSPSSASSSGSSRPVCNHSATEHS